MLRCNIAWNVVQLSWLPTPQRIRARLNVSEMSAAANFVPRILIVDDEPLVCWSLGSYLRMSGYETKAVYDGKSAMEELHAVRYDLLITDFRLPLADGFQVAAEAKKLPTNIPVIMISSYVDKIADLRATEKGVDRLVGKPYKLEEVASIVEHYVPIVRNEIG